VYLGADWQWPSETPSKGIGILVAGVLQKNGSGYQVRPVLPVDIQLEQIVVNENSASTTDNFATSSLDITPPASPVSPWLMFSPVALGGVGWLVYKLIITRLI